MAGKKVGWGQESQRTSPAPQQLKHTGEQALHPTSFIEYTQLVLLGSILGPSPNPEYFILSTFHFSKLPKTWHLKYTISVSVLNCHVFRYTGPSTILSSM